MAKKEGLDSFLDEEQPVAEEVKETAEAPVEQPQGDTEQEAGVEEAGPPPDKLPQDEYKALREERDKRQRLEAEIEALKQQFNQQPKEPAPPPPSMWEDEQGWQQHLQQQFMQQADVLSRINASEMAARSQNPDFQEMFDLFNSMAAQNPAVVQQAMTDPHPWGKAYQIAKNHKAMQELGAVDLADLEAKMREKIVAEMQTEQTPVPRPGAPPTLTGERNVGSRTGPAWAGPRSLDELLA